MNEFKSRNSYRHFANRIWRETRFIRTPEDDDFLREVARTSKIRIRELPEASELWRGQLGHDWRRYYQDDEYIDNLPELSHVRRTGDRDGWQAIGKQPVSNRRRPLAAYGGKGSSGPVMV